MSNPFLDADREVKEKSRQGTKEPRRYKVFLLNDNYTTMEFVVEILRDIFRKSNMDATRIMLHVHRNGKGLAGVYSKEIAETKIQQVHSRAREAGFPMKCGMEKE